MSKAEDDWNDYLRRSLGEINAAVERHNSGLFLPVKVMPPPTRVETIKEAWAEMRDRFDEEQIDGKLLVEHDQNAVEPMLFEVVTYGDITVVEAEGVVVERLARK